jgi:hypothetical protein
VRCCLSLLHAQRASSLMCSCADTKTRRHVAQQQKNFSSNTDNMTHLSSAPRALNTHVALHGILRRCPAPGFVEVTAPSSVPDELFFAMRSIHDILVYHTHFPLESCRGASARRASTVTERGSTPQQSSAEGHDATSTEAADARQSGAEADIEVADVGAVDAVSAAAAESSQRRGDVNAPSHPVTANTVAAALASALSSTESAPLAAGREEEAPQEDSDPTAADGGRDCAKPTATLRGGDDRAELRVVEEKPLDVTAEDVCVADHFLCWNAVSLDLSSATAST